MRYLFGEFSLDTDRRELIRAGQSVHVEPQVFDLLLHLIRNRDRVVTKDDLIASVWNGRVVAESTLNNRINAARQAIDDSGDERRFIRTVPRRGFRFVGDVSEAGPVDAGLAPGLTSAADSSVVASPAINDSPAFPPLPDKPSIAVLPFANLSDDPQQEYFADGMADEIITALSRCGWLFVIARNSSFTYKGRAVDVRQVGRELGVRYVLEGSVRRSGERLRITAQLIEATSGNHILADRFEGDLHDVFELQDRITESVVCSIEPQLQRAEIERLRQKPVANLDAYDLYLRALQLEGEFTEASLMEATQCLQRAYTLDSGYAPAMALAGWLYFERASNGWVEDRATEGAAVLTLAQRAVELNSNDANVLWMSANSFWYLKADAERARELFARSLSMNPNSPLALTMSAWLEMSFIELDTAIERISRAMRLSPRDPRGWMMSASMGMAKMWGRNFAESVVWCDRAIIQNPRMLPALRVKIVGLAHLGEREKAAEVVKEVLRIDPNFSISTWRNQRAPAAYRGENPAWNLFYEGLRAAGVPE